MYLVIGGTGYLGSYFIKNILENTEDKIIATYNTGKPQIQNKRIIWEKLDLSNTKSIDNFCEKLKKMQKKFKTVFLAAYHHPDKVEENKSFAYDINVKKLDYFLKKLQSNISTLYYSSTDSVYGESKTKNDIFKEIDACNPVNTYGKTKVDAEKTVLNYNFNVARFPFLIGPSIIQKPHFFDKIKECFEKNETMEMFEDSYRSPISFDQASKIVIELIEKLGSKMQREIINICGDEHLSKYDVALKIIEKYNFNPKLAIPIKFDGMQNIFKAKRAKSTLMNNDKLKKLLNKKNIKLNFNN